MNVKTTSTNHPTREDKTSAFVASSSPAISVGMSRSMRKTIHDDDDDDGHGTRLHSLTVTKSKNKENSGRKAKDSSPSKTENKVHDDHNFSSSEGDEDDDARHADVNHRLSLLAKRRETMAPSSSYSSPKPKQRHSSEYENDETHNDQSVDSSPIFDEEETPKKNNKGRSQQQKGSHKTLAGNASTQSTSSKGPIVAKVIGNRHKEENERKANTKNVLSAVDYARSGLIPKSAVALSNKQNPYRNLQRIPLNAPVPKNDANKGDGDTEGEGKEEEGERDAAGSTSPSLQLPSFDVPESILLSRRLKEKIEAIIQQEGPSFRSSQASACSTLPFSVISQEEGGFKLPPLTITTSQQPLMTPLLRTGTITMSTSPYSVALPLPSFGGLVSTTPKNNNQNTNNNNNDANRPLSSGVGSITNSGTLFVQNIVEAKVRKSEDFTVRYHETLPRIGGMYETKATIDALIEPVPLTFVINDSGVISGTQTAKTNNNDRIVDAEEIARKLRHQLNLQRASYRGQEETAGEVREEVEGRGVEATCERERIRTEQQQRNEQHTTASSAAAAIHPCIVVADKATVNKLRIDSKIQRASKMNFILHNNNEIRSHSKEEALIPPSAAQKVKSSWGFSPSTLPPVIIGGTNSIKLEHFLAPKSKEEAQSVSGHELYPFAIRRRRLLGPRQGRNDNENKNSQPLLSNTSNWTGGIIEGEILVVGGGGENSYEQDEKEENEEDEEGEEEETSEANPHSAEAFYRFNSTQQQQRRGMSNLAEVKTLNDAQQRHRLAFVSTLKNARRMEIVTGVRKGGLPHQFLAQNAALSQWERAIVDAKSSVALTQQTETKNRQESDLSGLLGLGGTPRDKPKSKKKKKTTIFRKIMVFSEEDGSIRATMVAVGEGEQIVTEDTEPRNNITKRNSSLVRRRNSNNRRSSIMTSVNNMNDYGSEGWENDANDELQRNKRERKRASTLVDAITANASGAYTSHLQRNARNNHSDPIAPTPAAQLKSAYAPVRHMKIIRVDIAVDVRAEEETFATLARLHAALKAEAAKSQLLSSSSSSAISSPLSFSPERQDLIGKIREALNPEHLMSELSRDRVFEAAGLGVDEARRNADGVLYFSVNEHMGSSPPRYVDGRSSSHPIPLKSLISVEISPPTSVYRNVNGVPTQQGARLEDFIRRRERANIFGYTTDGDDKNKYYGPDEEGSQGERWEGDTVRFEPPSEVEQYLHEKLTIPPAITRTVLPHQSDNGSGNKMAIAIGSTEASQEGDKQHKRLSSMPSLHTRTSTVTPLPNPRGQSSSSATRGKRKDSVLPFGRQISHQREDSSVSPYPLNENSRNGAVASSSAVDANAKTNKTSSSSENNNNNSLLYARRCCFISLSAPSNSVPEDSVNRAHAALLLALNTTRNPIRTRILSAIDCSSIIPELLSAIEQDREMREARLDELAWESHRRHGQNSSTLDTVAQKRAKKVKTGNDERVLFSARAVGGSKYDGGDGAFGANSLIEASTLETMRDLSKATAACSSLHPSRSSPRGMNLNSNSKGYNGVTPSLALGGSSYRGPKSGENSGGGGGVSIEGGAWDTLEEDERRHRLLDLKNFAVIDVLARQTEVLRLGFIQRQEKESPRKSNGDPRGEELLPCYIMVGLDNAAFTRHNVGVVYGVSNRNSDIAVTNGSATKMVSALNEKSTALGPLDNLIGEERGSGKEGYVHELSSSQGLVTLSNSLTMTTANRATTRLGAVGMGDAASSNALNNNNNTIVTPVASNAPPARSGNVPEVAASPTAATKSYFGAVESQRLQRKLEMLRQPEPDVAFEVIPPFQSNNNNNERK